jgi:aspartyl-tRNA(Asn)/glutamyl-tRNA(Gln) amidotransferase subunit C
LIGVFKPELAGQGDPAVAAQNHPLLYGGLNSAVRGFIIMSVDAATVRRIAHLARIAVTESEIPHLQGELNAMLAFVEQLSEVNVEGVEPMTSVTPMDMKKRADVVNDGGIADDIVGNAPETQDHFFLVPKVVE